ADLEGAAGDLAAVDVEVAGRLDRVDDLDPEALALGDAGVADLAAALAVEGRRVGDELDLVADLRGRLPDPADGQREDAGAGAELGVAGEARGPGEPLLEPEVEAVD